MHTAVYRHWGAERIPNFTHKRTGEGEGQRSSGRAATFTATCARACFGVLQVLTCPPGPDWSPAADSQDKVGGEGEEKVSVDTLRNPRKGACANTDEKTGGMTAAYASVHVYMRDESSDTVFTHSKSTMGCVPKK